jgi:hypothetical protein
VNPFSPPWRTSPTADLRRPVNHMLKHGWKLLHVGQQTLEVHETVAVLGEPAASRE